MISNRNDILMFVFGTEEYFILETLAFLACRLVCVKQLDCVNGSSVISRSEDLPCASLTHAIRGEIRYAIRAE